MSPKQQLFIEAYLANGSNATQAAITAGYSQKTAKSQGQRLLTNVDIQKRLNERVEAAAMTADQWMKEVAELARQAERDSDRLTAYGLLGKPLNLTNNSKVENSGTVEIVTRVIEPGE